jgi:Zn-dependent M16 (insulinase) family peptidase
VNYVGKAANLFDAGFRVHGALLLAARYLSNTYLWEEVRVRGGAYGGFCRLDPRTGTFLFLSYRDPNVEKTVDIYDGACDFLRRIQLSRDEIDKSIIGIIGDMDAYELPDAKGFNSALRYLTGETDELRQKRRDEIFSARIEDFRQLADALAQVREHGSVVVLGASESIRRAESCLKLERVEPALPGTDV